MYSLEEKVKRFAITSRLAILVMQFVTNLLVPDHDAEVFQKPLHSNRTFTFVDHAVNLLFGGLTRWDGQYFLHVAEYGYTYENTLAFFPMFPLVARQLTNFVNFFIIDHLKHAFFLNQIISTNSTLILMSVLFNNYIFVKTAGILYKLGLIVLKNERIAYVSAILFCINPASVFFSAVYSESLYCFLTFYGLLKIEEKTACVNYIIIGLTGCVRSNGIINIGFLVYKFIKIKTSTKPPFFYKLIFNFQIILAALPFVAYQSYAFGKFCFDTSESLPHLVTSYGKKFNFVYPGDVPEWCFHRIPFPYSYVQKHYWNVGFLNYYQFKQIPNFILAAPMVYIIFRGTYKYVKQYKFLLFYLGFIKGDAGKELPITVFPYVVHAFALTVFSILMIHVQVTTRLLASSSPVPYWYCAHSIASLFENPIEGQVLKKLSNKNEDIYYYEDSKTRKSSWKSFLFTEKLKGFPFFVKWYFFGYFFVGTAMFSNYLPWT